MATKITTLIASLDGWSILIFLSTDYLFNYSNLIIDFHFSTKNLSNYVLFQNYYQRKKN